MTDSFLAALEHAGYVAVGAGLTALTQWSSGTNFGVWTPAVVGVLSVLTAFITKLSKQASGN